MSIQNDCQAIIPCRNEAGSIGELVREVLRYVPHALVVDDHSSDETAIRARAAGARVLALESYQGKGAALRRGFEECLRQGISWALTLDGDRQHLPSDIPRLLNRAEKGDVGMIIGNRMHQPSGMPVVRRCANRLMSALLSRRIRQRLPDTQCGFRLIRLDPAFVSRLSADHFEIESDQLIAALSCGWRIDFVPVTTVYNTMSSHIQILPDTLRWIRWYSKVRLPKRIGFVTD